MPDPPAEDVRLTAPAARHLRQVAALRLELAEQDGRDPGTGRSEFLEGFTRWCDEHRDSHLCLVGTDRDDAVVAFGFLALTPRVPTVGLRRRCSADVQAVFVIPPRRGSGIGGRLVAALVDLARRRGAEHVTVHSSTGAVRTYERAGFVHDPLMLNQPL